MGHQVAISTKKYKWVKNLESTEGVLHYFKYKGHRSLVVEVTFGQRPKWIGTDNVFFFSLPTLTREE